MPKLFGMLKQWLHQSFTYLDITQRIYRVVFEGGFSITLDVGVHEGMGYIIPKLYALGVHCDLYSHSVLDIRLKLVGKRHLHLFVHEKSG